MSSLIAASVAAPVATGASLTALTIRETVSVAREKADVPPLVAVETFEPALPEVWSYARKVNTPFAVPLKLAVGTKCNLASLPLEGSSKALVSETVPTKVQFVPSLRV